MIALFRRWNWSLENWSFIVSAALTVLATVTAGIIVYDTLRELVIAVGAVTEGVAWLWPIPLFAILGLSNVIIVQEFLARERLGYAWSIFIITTAILIILVSIYSSHDILLSSPIVRIVLKIGINSLPAIAIFTSIFLIMQLVSFTVKRKNLRHDLDEHRSLIDRLKTEITDLERQRNTAQTSIKSLRTKIALLQRQQSIGTSDPKPDSRAAAAARRKAELSILLGDQTDIAPATIKEWAARFGVSERTIQRDIKELQGTS